MVTQNNIKERILSILMEDSRKSFRKIAKELNISTTTVSRIVQEFERAGVITGYTTLINWHKMGFDATMCLQLSASPEADIDAVGKELRRLPELKQVFYTTGDSTFSAYAVCKDTKDAAILLEKLRAIPGLERIIPHTVLKIY